MTSIVKQLSHLLNELKNQDSGAQYPIISYNKAKELELKIKILIYLNLKVILLKFYKIFI